ncbi:hypothetical protein FVF58_00215 [Paraburkholderia panacisoli]|uniref:Uncharacterized protein n=1 Tax=Paraburkholderia panacisoli TaxID=2603818 RepID=A0A5B0HLY7_9BURK|nr:hypothetical protein [Paraburkholderia panacisoli]KAA1015823.1 hypothetical protein FVF58_00215 [Paraburkholderia panacisoli]
MRKRERAHRTEQAAKIVPTIGEFIDEHYAKRVRASIKTPDRTIAELRKLGAAFPGALNRISVRDMLEWAYSEPEKEVGEDRTMNEPSHGRVQTYRAARPAHARGQARIHHRKPGCTGHG